MKSPMISSSQNFYQIPAHEVATFGSNSPLGVTDTAFTFEKPRKSSREVTVKVNNGDSNMMGRTVNKVLTQRAMDQSPILTGGKRNLNRESRGSENR